MWEAMEKVGVMKELFEKQAMKQVELKERARIDQAYLHIHKVHQASENITSNKISQMDTQIPSSTRILNFNAWKTHAYFSATSLASTQLAERNRGLSLSHATKNKFKHHKSGAIPKFFPSHSDIRGHEATSTSNLG